MGKTVLIVSTLDTKGPETLYLKERLASLGLGTVLMDLSMREDGPAAADIPPSRVAEAAGTTLAEIRSSKERAKITNLTIQGASKLAGDLFTQGRIAGLIAIGGSTGSLMATDVMRTLPFGVPKLMVSSTAALPGLSTRYIGTGDILLFHSVVEISGVTDLLRNVLDRAACAMHGLLAEDIASPRALKGKALAMTMLGPCEKCASAVRTALEGAGHQVIGFSAAGIGDRAMDEMITQGLFHGVIDLAPGGVGEHLYGCMRDAGPDRLSAAGRAGIPQVVSTCSVNHMTPAKSKYKPEYHQRKRYDLDRHRTWLRMSEDELREVARVFADKLNPARGPVAIVIPLRGWSSVDVPDNPTFDPEADRVFIEELRVRLKPDIRMVEVDANMEDPGFAQSVSEVALEMF